MENKETKDLIQQLVDGHAASNDKDLFRQMLTTVVRLYDEDAADPGDLKLVNQTLKELRNAFKIFADYREHRKVTIFGSARTEKGSADYEMAKLFSEEIVKHGYMVITGAGGGIMEAGNEGAGADNSFGVNIKLPFEQEPNPAIKNDPKCMTFKYFFSRKLMFVKEADATVLFPGGFGTLDEAAESLTLIQTGKCRARPIILLDHKDSTFWDEWISFLKEKLWKRGLISENDIKLFSHHQSIDGAVQEIKNFYRIYNSMRYMGDKTVLYLKKSLEDSLLERININFSDIINGQIRVVSEIDKPQKNGWASPYYLIFKFSRNNFGRLTEMIHYINKYG